MIEIELLPVAPGRWSALCFDEELGRSRTPFLDAARVLKARGIDPDTVLVARHRGSGTVAMRSTIGKAAEMAIHERDRGGFYRGRYEPMPDSLKNRP